MDTKETPLPNVLLVSFPAPGHINPMLSLGKLLASKGFFVTFAAPKSAGDEHQQENNVNSGAAVAVGDGFLVFHFFDDGWTLDAARRIKPAEYMMQLESVGKAAVSEIINYFSDRNKMFSCIINNPFLPWVCDLASDHGIPCAVLWNQSIAVLTTYYHYLQKTVHFPSHDDPYVDVKLPSLPLLKYDEIPTFLHPFSTLSFIGTQILEQIKSLSRAFCVLADTFFDLEQDYINDMSKYFSIRPIGPLFCSQKTEAVGSGAEIQCSSMKSDDGCIEWLNSKPAVSVVYISFGSVVNQPREQVIEIAHALLDSQVPFLWVLKPLEEDSMLPHGFLDIVGSRGKVVQWSPQEEVLSHPSVSCFVTHCGWNSSLEALTHGVPVLAFPALADQVTNAKFLVDVFGVGVRLGKSQIDGEIITRDWIMKCLVDATRGKRAEELKMNALRWKAAAKTAVAHGGYSNKSIDAFAEDIRRKSREMRSYVAQMHSVTGVP